MAPKHPPGPAMTLGNMRELGLPALTQGGPGIRFEGQANLS
jgi:hypothetical protein